MDVLIRMRKDMSYDVTLNVIGGVPTVLTADEIELKGCEIELLQRSKSTLRIGVNDSRFNDILEQIEI